jgi:hypothetical protein
MVRRTVVLLLLATMALGAQEMERKRTRLWKWSIAVLAAANVSDAMSSMGRYELNPVLGNGRFGMRATGVKIGISTATIGLEYLILRRRPEAARKAAYANFGMAGLTGGIAARNALRQRSLELRSHTQSR